MKLIDLFYLSFQNLKNRKSRVFLTILGVSIGIGAILFLVSLGYGLQQNLLDRITTEESLLTLDIVSSDDRVIMINNRTIQEINLIDGVERVSPQAVFPSQVSLGGLTSETTINVVNPDFFSLVGVTPNIGRLFKEEDEKKIVVNSSVAELFNLETNQILGKKLGFYIFLSNEEEDEGVKIYQTTNDFEVVGIIEDVDAPSLVYLKSGDLLGLNIEEYPFAKVKVVDDGNMEEVRTELIAMGFLVSALSDIINQANQIFRGIQIVLGIFGVVALIVAAIGLINTMTISLLERTNEIGIMRSIGASPKDIQRLFLGESFIIGFLGGISGIGVGILGAEIFNIAVDILTRTLGGQPIDLFVYPVWFAISIVIVSTLVGLIAGFFPSRRAAKLKPLDALRYK